MDLNISDPSISGLFFRSRAISVYDPNLLSFRRRGIVNYYRQLRQLQAAEQTILNLLGETLSQMKVLDLGVGAGRTTPFVAQRSFDYTGVDYSPEMIQICEQRFSGLGERVRFQVCDVRDLSMFSSRSFDFILFSFNGIDNISHQERLTFLSEVARLGKSGSFFAFSTHNLQAIIPEFSLKSRLSWNPVESYVNGMMWGVLKFFNRSLSADKLREMDYAIIRDESHNFRLRQYYIRPKAQLAQLSEFFQETTVLSWQSGEVISEDELKHQMEMWCYYLCQLPA